MIKFKALALVAAGLFAASTLFAHDQACCAGQPAGKMAKDGCSATFANLNLTPAQKAKMEKLGDDCMKGGCNTATMAKMKKSARGVLTKKQFAAWKTACTQQGEHDHS